MIASQTRSLGELQHCLRNGGDAKFMFFWGHKPGPRGMIGKACFCQTWPSKFQVNGQLFPTATHYIAATKAQLFDDSKTLAAILATSDPSQAVTLGNHVAGLDEAVWARHRYETVIVANREKFSQNIVLGAYLVATGVQVLAEANPDDCISGIGLAEDHADAPNPERWRGQNLLGFALMEVRDLLSRSF